ncbi:hypothetical protein JQN72_12265 [Phycicoccus sp. CSK15P-2]|uniref:hypothetical protein n=1 Tax=Phycicoccus sp. CSK15P-2 TaxID=2807627 RepID=UPI001951A183|nr:hypothetical protein [Phycicoccus sp. CSK15P-2]MBM6405017.1 hypothetical protein [Phycicoccus sp. CSK15P-2]
MTTTLSQGLLRRALTATVVAAVSVTTFAVTASPASASDLGVNYNGLTRAVNDSELDRVGTGLARGFLDIRALQRGGVGSLDSDPDVAGFTRISGTGRRAVLNLKFDFRGDSFPADADSTRFKDLRAFTTEVLDRVYASTDVLVVGNEPFIESDPADRNQSLVDFYTHMANHVIAYNKTRRDIPVYVGAFNNLQKSGWRTPATEKLIAYAKNTPRIAGIDLHMHVGAIPEMDQAITWARGRLGGSKGIISTEFSLKNHFKAQLGKPVNAGFASRHAAVNPSWKVWQYLDFSLRNPRPRAEWVDFLKSSDWFFNVRFFLGNADELFDRKNLRFATYAMRQSQSSIGPNTDPWILNGIYCNQTCTRPGGTSQLNYAWVDSFRNRT